MIAIRPVSEPPAVDGRCTACRRTPSALVSVTASAPWESGTRRLPVPDGAGDTALTSRYPPVVRLLLLTQAVEPSAEVLPALGLLAHAVRILPAQATALLDAPPCDVVLVDGRRDLPQVRSLTRLIRQTGVEHPVILVVTEGGLTAVQRDWGVDEFILDTCGPAELEARLRLSVARMSTESDEGPAEIRSGDLSIDEAGYDASRQRGAAAAEQQLDDGVVRVTKWTFPPGTETGPHVHAFDYVVVPVTDGELTIETDDTSAVAPITIGVSYQRGKGVAHNVANDGDTTVAFVEVELLDR